MAQFKVSLDICVEPLSREAYDQLQWIKWNAYDGTEIVSKLQLHTTILGKKMPEIHPLEGSEEITRRISVIHYDGRDEPVVYGIPVIPNQTTLEELGETLETHVSLAENEHFLFGWCAFGTIHGISGFLNPCDIVPRNDSICHMLTAWRVPKLHPYATVEYYGTPEQRTLTPTVIVPHPNLENTTFRSIHLALTPFLPDDVPMERAFENATYYTHPLPPKHDEYEVARLRVFLGDQPIQRYTRFGRVHETAAPRRFNDEWKHEGARLHREEALQRASAEGLVESIRNSSKFCKYTIEIIDDTTIRLNMQSKTAYTPVIPFMEGDHFQRWHTSMHISRQYMHLSFLEQPWPLLDHMTVADDAPRAPQPPSISVALKYHQLQNLYAMQEKEAMLGDGGFFGMVYARLPNGMVWYDPRSSMIKNLTIGDIGNAMMPPCRSGGFLCDDVGLGKTLTILSLCAADSKKVHRDSRFRTDISRCDGTLIICPPSILGQWKHEIAKYTNLKAYVYYGKSKESLQHLSTYDIVLTTYTTYLKSLDVLQSCIWYRCVFDESHTMSDRFAMFSPYSCLCWCVSATPLHNIQRQLRALHVPGTHYYSHRGMTELYYILEPMVVRHTRDQTEIDTEKLPEIRELIVPIKFETEEERALYQQAHRRCVQELRDTTRPRNMLKYYRYFKVLQNLCTNGAWSMETLFSEQTPLQSPDFTLVAPHDDEDMCPICMNDFDQPVVTTCHHWFCSDCIATALDRSGLRCPMCRTPQRHHELRLGVLFGQTPGESRESVGVECASKINALLHALDAMRCEDPTAKALIFCTTGSTLPIIGAALKEQGFKYRSIHGSMPPAQRGNAINAFQTDPKTTVFLLSLRSAAAGINLTAANTIFFVGPAIHRSSYEQAIGRAHRFGQKRPVKVHHLFMEGTIEESLISALQTTRLESVDLMRALF